MRYIVAASAGLLAFSACSSIAGPVNPPGRGVPASTSSTYTYYKVDFSPCGTGSTTSSKCDTVVTGINDSKDIVGNDITAADLPLQCSTTSSGGVRSNVTSALDSCDCPIPSGEGMSAGYYWRSFVSDYTGYTDTASPTLVTAIYPYYRSSQFLYGIGNRSSSSDANSTVEVGCVVNFVDGPNLRATFGVTDNGGILNAGVWSVLSKSGASSNNNCSGGAVGDQLSIDGGNNAIGYYNYYNGKSTDCDLRPWIDEPGDTHPGITVTFTGANSCGFPGTSSGTNPLPVVVATGISSDGDYIVGFAKTSTGATAGWWGSYSTAKNAVDATLLCYDNAKGEPTAFTGVTDSASGKDPVIVGWYSESNSTSAKTHGFVYTTSDSGWSQPINAKGALGYTVISGTNNSGDICGWYKGGDGYYHGFVGIKTPGARTETHRRTVNPRV